MASPLVRVNLMLDRNTYQRLKRISARQRKSVSQLTREILQQAVETGFGTREEEDVVTRIRRLREQVPPLEDSSDIIRASRLAGWK